MQKVSKQTHSNPDIVSQLFLGSAKHLDTSVSFTRYSVISEQRVGEQRVGEQRATRRQVASLFIIYH